MSGGDRGDTEFDMELSGGAPVLTYDYEETTTLLGSRTRRVTYRSTETGHTLPPPRGQPPRVNNGVNYGNPARRGHADVRGNTRGHNRRERQTPPYPAAARPARDAPTRSGERQTPPPPAAARPARDTPTRSGERQTPASSPAARPAQNSPARSTPTTRATPRAEQAWYKTVLYIILLVIGVLISVADLFMGVYMKYFYGKGGNGSGESNDDDTPVANPVWFLVMGGVEALFVIWHTCTLAVFMCCKRRPWSVLTYWVFRIVHLGAILLVILIILMGRFVWPSLPDIFVWSWATGFLFISTITKFATLLYWAMELVFDINKSLYC